MTGNATVMGVDVTKDGSSLPHRFPKGWVFGWYSVGGGDILEYDSGYSNDYIEIILDQVPDDGSFPFLYAEDGPEYRTISIRPVLGTVSKSHFRENDIWRMLYNENLVRLDGVEFAKLIDEYGDRDEELKALIENRELIRTSPEVEDVFMIYDWARFTQTGVFIPSSFADREFLLQ